MTHIPDEAVQAALLSLAKDNIGTDVQGLLMHGFDKLNAKPNALRNALAAAIPHLQPVDVAAVRRQAFEEGFENGVEQSLNALDAYDDITRNEAEQGIRELKPDYRALSAEPVQGDQWRDIATVGERERLIIIGSYNAKGSWCAEVWHTKYLRDQQAKSASGFFMNAPHLEWVPTHFMELPAAPNTEAEA